MTSKMPGICPNGGADPIFLSLVNDEIDQENNKAWKCYVTSHLCPPLAC